MSRALLDAFRLADTPPCDKFSCSQRSRCSDDELACSAFERYASNGEVLHPYIQIRMSPSGKGRPIMRMGEEARPTAEIYQRIFSDESEASERTGPMVDEVLEYRSADRQIEHWWQADSEAVQRVLDRLNRHALFD